MIEPGVLEGDDDLGDDLGDTGDAKDSTANLDSSESSSSDDGDGDGIGDSTGDDLDDGTSEGTSEGTGDSSTGESDGDIPSSECMVGTDFFGGPLTNEFPAGSCALSCDQGWGHVADKISNEWTRHFVTLEGEQTYDPVAVLPRVGGDGVVVVSRRDAGTELLTLSADGLQIDTLVLPAPTPWLARAESDQGVIYLAYADPENDASLLVAVNEAGDQLWWLEREGWIRDLAVVPGEGVVMGLFPNDLVRVTTEGKVAWTAPTLVPSSIAVSSLGHILVGGTTQDAEAALKVHTANGSLFADRSFVGAQTQLSRLLILGETLALATGSSEGPSDASVDVIALNSANEWHHLYNRALDSCDDANAPTQEWFGEAARLADGTLMITGAHQGPLVEGLPRMQPLVFHIDAQGEFLALDRGLWLGQATAIAADEAGSAYVAMTEETAGVGAPANGIVLRKYTP
ncbi:hypothetical protein ACNOYE_29995 [Nannocystaceae bacterium ST9]